jgi:hypothetical protein
MITSDQSVAVWEPSSTIGHVSRSLPTIPDGRISHIRFYLVPAATMLDRNLLDLIQ